jgi:hypothetical protein
MNVPGGCNVGGLLGNGNDNDDIVVADFDVDVPIAEQVENGKVYTMHVFGGCHHWVPCDWTWPHCNTWSLWKQWWMVDGR